MLLFFTLCVFSTWEVTFKHLNIFPLLLTKNLYHWVKPLLDFDWPLRKQGHWALKKFCALSCQLCRWFYSDTVQEFLCFVWVWSCVMIYTWWGVDKGVWYQSLCCDFQVRSQQLLPKSKLRHYCLLGSHRNLKEGCFPADFYATRRLCTTTTDTFCWFKPLSQNYICLLWCL